MSLTPRQAEIAALVGCGLSSKEIAQETGLSVETVNVHIKQAAKRVGGDGLPRYRLTLWVFQIKSDPA